MATDANHFAARQFRADVRALAKRLRQLDPEIKKQAKAKGRQLVGEPMLAHMQQAARRSPWYPKIASSLKTTAAATPTIKATAAPKVFSGGGSTRDVVPGAVWGGGGKSSKAIAATGERRGYRRITTNQFKGTGTDFLFEPVARHSEELLAAWGKVIDAALTESELD